MGAKIGQWKQMTKPELELLKWGSWEQERNTFGAIIREMMTYTKRAQNRTCNGKNPKI
jgi:hypothetical protein